MSTNDTNKQLHPVQLISHSRIVEQGVVLEFSITTQSNNLTYHQPYSKRQEIVFKLIQFMYSEGLGYRKIALKLNSYGIKTARDTGWTNTKVFSILKRKKQRDERVEELRLREYPIVFTSFEFKYYD